MTKDGEDADEAADDLVMRSMRSVWLTMRDEAPPQRGMAELLAAARIQAEAMQPKASWWRRAVAVIWRPPVLALATALVLVGGALIVNNHSDDLEVATTRETSRIERLDSVATPAAPSERDTVREPQTEPAVAPEPPGGSRTNTIVTEAPRVPPRATRGPRPVEPPPPSKEEHGSVVAGGASADVTIEGRPGADKSPRPAETDGLLIAGESAPAQTADAAAATARSHATVETAAAGRRPQPQLIEQLVKQTEVAAVRKDCPAVRATADRVKKLDANVFRSRVANQPAIATCLN